MPAIKGTDMDMPLSSGLHSLFERQLEEEYQACTTVVEKMIKRAHELGKDLDAESTNISNHELIKELMSNL